MSVLHWSAQLVQNNKELMQENAMRTIVNGIVGDHKAHSFELLSGDLGRGLILLCDHADNAFPEGYGTLGLPVEELGRHIAYDIGAAGVTRELSRLLGVPAVLSRYSRLLIDPNRSIDDPTLVMKLSDGAVVPGNAQIHSTEIQKRIELYYKPYHNCIDKMIDNSVNVGRMPALFSVHSFTPTWKSIRRIWDSTVLWDKDPRLAEPLIRALESEADIIAGENVPYTGQLAGDCLYQHGTMRGLAHALIEIRQDLIDSQQGQIAWAERLARVLETILSAEDINKSINRVQFFGSHTDE